MTLNTGTTFVRIQSDSDPNKQYSVEIENGHAWWCECRDWQFRRPTNGCKHMVTAQRDLDSTRDFLVELSQ